MNVNKTLDEDIKEFGVWKLYKGRLAPAPEIQTKDDYTHWAMDLHHYIKAQSYKRNRLWYIQNGIKQKLILMPRCMHVHLENPVYNLSEEKFYNLYHIHKDMLLFNKRKWIDEEVRKGNYER